MLLEADADPNVQDENGTTLLHQAVEARNLEIVKLLLVFKANPNLINKDGLTPLDLAEKIGDMRIIDVLRRNGGKKREELEEEKKKKRFRISGGGQRVEIPSAKRSSKPGSKSDSRSVDSEVSNLGRDLFSDPEMPWFNSHSGQSNSQANSDAIREQPIPTSHDNWKTSNLKKQAQKSMLERIEENIQAEQGKIILCMTPARGIEIFLRLLMQILQPKSVASDRKVFALSRSSKRNEYYPEKVSTRRKQLSLLAFISHRNLYYSKREYRKHFNGVSLSGRSHFDNRFPNEMKYRTYL
jgi:hypothetical protein